MAVQTVKSGFLLTVPATEDSLIITAPFPVNGNIKFVNVSGTTKFAIGGPINDPLFTGITTAGTVVKMRVDTMAQLTDDSQRIHVLGVGTWRVMY